MGSKRFTAFFIVSALLIAAPTFADENTNETENIGSVSVPDGYIAEGPFKWTRAFWKWTGNAMRDGHATIVKSDGDIRTKNFWGVVGYKATYENIHTLKREGWNFLNDYWSGSDRKYSPRKKDEYWSKKREVSFFNKQGGTFLGWIGRLFSKPWSHIQNSWTDLTIATEKNNYIIERNFQGEITKKEFRKGSWGPVGTPFVFVFNNLWTLKDAIWIMGMELPVRIVSGTAYRLLYPFYPILSSTALWFIGEPLNLALNGTATIAAGALGSAAIATMLGLESIKFLVWDSWHLPSNEDFALAKNKEGEIVGIYKVPSNPFLDKEVSRILSESESKAEFKASFDHLVEWMDENQAWLALSYISQKLSQTEIALNKELLNTTDEKGVALSEELAVISKLKLEYGMALETQLQNKFNSALAIAQ